MTNDAQAFSIRPARPGDLDQVIAIDERVTGIAKRAYWRDLHERYTTRQPEERFFYVAQSTAPHERGRILGFIIGEVRAWEFGSEPCGWVFAISVDPEARQEGIGEALLEAITESFRRIGVRTLRTVIARDNHLLMSFFRSEGMRAGPYLQLEKELD